MARQGDRDTTPRWASPLLRAQESTDRIWLRLTATEPGTCRFTAGPAAVESGLRSSAFAYRSPVLVEGDLLAYLALRGSESGALRHRCG